jgi:hypothetical protein
MYWIDCFEFDGFAIFVPQYLLAYVAGFVTAWCDSDTGFVCWLVRF